MGHYWFDQYSILHFATGILAYFWGVGLYLTMMVHILFELFENTTYGMWFINNWLPFWPGGKDHADSLVNNISDTLFTGVGWIISYKLDKYYS
jgi:hypothetical protein